MKIEIRYQAQKSVIPTDDIIKEVTGHLAALLLLSEQCTQFLFYGRTKFHRGP